MFVGDGLGDEEGSGPPSEDKFGLDVAADGDGGLEGKEDTVEGEPPSEDKFGLDIGAGDGDSVLEDEASEITTEFELDCTGEVESGGAIVELVLEAVEPGLSAEFIPS